MSASSAAGLGLVLAAGLGTAAAAQTHVGENIEGGLYWHVSTPQGASWSLECRFPPVTYYRNRYDQTSWINRFNREGRGAQSGRLPLNTGHCNLTKTGGNGPVAIALAKTGATDAAAVREIGQTATASLF